MLVSSINPVRFEAITRRSAQIIKPFSRAIHPERRIITGLDLRRQAANGIPRKASRRALVGKAPDQSHYLGYRPLPGACLRYFAHAAVDLALALLGFGAAACKASPSGPFIRWDPHTRQRNLPVFVDQARYLILPWILLPCPTSCLLALVARRRLRD